MGRGLILPGLAIALAAPALGQSDELGFHDTPYLPGGVWRVHDADRPQPQPVSPGVAPGAPPSDAIVLFDGHSLDGWRSPYRAWEVRDGVLTIPPRAPDAPENALETRRGFGDIQLHLEFRTPNPPQNHSQERGNSGIWLMQRYEVQILDSYHNPTFADGVSGALFGWKPPLVNPSRKPGEWQSVDLVFERPHFATDGSLQRPAYVTVLLNGVLVQNHQAILGTVAYRKVGAYKAHGDTAPLRLQDHGFPVSFRNIWVRPLPPDAIAQDSIGGRP